MNADGGWGNLWGNPLREDLAGRLQEQMARGRHTVDALAAAVGAAAPEVADALAWGVGQGLFSRATGPDGSWFELTPHGAATLGFRQSIQHATGPDGRVHIGDVVADMAEAAQAADTARRRQAEQDAAHLLVGTPEREAAVSLLKDAYTRGTFDLDELERRSALAMAARTRGDLAVATADLAWTPSGLPARAPGAAFPAMSTTTVQVSPLVPRSVAQFMFGPARIILFAVLFVFLGLPVLVMVLMTFVGLLVGH